jgi:hypothetical protein
LETVARVANGQNSVATVGRATGTVQSANGDFSLGDSDADRVESKISR